MAVNYNELKQGGFMKQIQKDHFSFRLRIVGGQIETKQMLKVYEIAEKYGQGYAHMTSRQSIEIPFIKLEDVEIVRSEMAASGLLPGVCGPRVRTITACQGNKVCPSGLIDALELAKEFDRRYFARELPHKFKLGITGCSNNCLKAEENDLGVKGGIQPEWDEKSCSFCGLCEAVCPRKAIKVQKKDKQLEFNVANCNACGKCLKSCPLDAWSGKSGYIVYFGGLFGNQIATGRQLLPIIYSEERLHQVVETTLEFFKRYGKRNERFGLTMERVGWDKLESELAQLMKTIETPETEAVKDSCEEPPSQKEYIVAK